jgi:predicted O-methyltransferase YrrM
MQSSIAGLWSEKLSQDARGLPRSERHRNLEPPSAEFICALAAGSRAHRLLEVGGSSGLSTIALAAAARQTGGRLVSIEIEPARQALARQRLAGLGLSDRIDFVLADAGQVLAQYDALEFVLTDCEKEDCERLLALLRLAPGALVVADNILSHGLGECVSAVRSYPGVESITLAIGKGLEVSRFVNGSAGRSLGGGAVEQGDERDEARSISELRSVSAVFGGLVVGEAFGRRSADLSYVTRRILRGVPLRCHGGNQPPGRSRRLATSKTLLR